MDPRLLPLALALTALPAAARAADPAPPRPHVVLLMADDQGWGDAGYAGHPALKTPHLDAMAANGLRFDRFYSAYPVCGPSRASLMAGRHAHRWGGNKHGTFDGRQRTLAQVVKDAGYATAHFGKWHLGRLDPGGPTNPRKVGFDRCLSSFAQFNQSPALTDEKGAVHRTTGDGSDVIAAAAVRFLREALPAGKPLFVVVWYGSAHSAHLPLEQDLAPYKGQPNAGYLGELAALDRSVGTIRQALRDLKIADDTLVWYCSDNGGAGKNAPLTGGKFTVWEGGLRVPGLVEWPARVKAGSRTAVPASHMDILPTVAAAAGVTDVKARGPLDGVSLLPLFDGKAAARPTPIPFVWHDAYGLIDNRYKLIVGPPGNAKGSPDPDQVRLFDVAADPGEKTDLAAEEPAVTARMREAAEAWKKQAEAEAGGAPRKGK